MKSFFSRRQDSTPTGHTKSASKESYKFWNTNPNPQEDASKPRPLHGDETPQYTTSQPQPRASTTQPIKTAFYNGVPSNTYGDGPSREQASSSTFRPSASMTAPHNDAHIHPLATSKAMSTRPGDYLDKPHPAPPVASALPYTNTISRNHIPNKSSRHVTTKNEPSSSNPPDMSIPSHIPSTSRQPPEDQRKDSSRVPDAQLQQQLRHAERDAAPMPDSRRDREQERPRDRTKDRVRDTERERTRNRSTQERNEREVDHEKDRRRNQSDRPRDRDRERDRAARDAQRDLDRIKEKERDREIQYRRERQLEHERNVHKESQREQHERFKEQERERQKDREREREKEKDRERAARRDSERDQQLQREKQIAKDAERERGRRNLERELRERDQQVQREREIAKEAEKEKEKERRERERDQQASREKEIALKEAEKEKQKEKDRERRQREWERDRDLQLQREKEFALKEAEKEKERERRQREWERERDQQLQRENDIADKEAEKEKERERRQREWERERDQQLQRDKEAALKEAEKEKERELRQREWERERDQQLQRDKEAALKEAEKEKERERRQREWERERDQQLQREKDIASKEAEKEKERERRQREWERERDQQLQRDKEAALKEAEKETARQRREQERERELQLQRDKEAVLKEAEKEKEKERRQREWERERYQQLQRDKEAALKEAERQHREHEREREQQLLREKEIQRENEIAKEAEQEKEREHKQREREREQQQEKEKERERDRERRREWEWERAKEKERLEKIAMEHEQKDREQAKIRAREAEAIREHDKDRERARERYLEREKRTREKEAEADKMRTRAADRHRDRRKERDVDNNRTASASTKLQTHLNAPIADGGQAIQKETANTLTVDPPRQESRSHDYPSRKEELRSRDSHRNRTRDRESRHRAEATDGEQDLRRPQNVHIDREKRREANQNGWVSDNFISHNRKYMRHAPRGNDDAEGSDGSARRKKVVQERLLTERNPVEKTPRSRPEKEEGHNVASSAVQPIPYVLSVVPPTPRQQTRTHLPPHGWKTKDNSSLQGPSTAVPIASTIPSTPNLQIRSYLQPHDALKASDNLLPHSSSIAPDTPPVLTQEQTEVQPRREINRLKLYPRPVDPVFHSLPVPSVSRDQSYQQTPATPSFSISHTNSNRHHAPVQQIPSISLQAGISDFPSTLSSQPRAAPPAGQQVAASASTTHAYTNIHPSQSAPDQPKPVSQSMAQTPIHSHSPGFVAMQSSPSTVLSPEQLVPNNTTRTQINDQSEPRKNSLNDMKPEILSAHPVDRVVQHAPAGLAHTGLPINHSVQPRNSPVTGLLSISSAMEITRDAFRSTEQPVIPLSDVHQRYTNSKPTDASPRQISTLDATVQDNSPRHPKTNMTLNMTPPTFIQSINVPMGQADVPLSSASRIIPVISAAPSYQTRTSSAQIYGTTRMVSIPLPHVETSAESKLEAFPTRPRLTEHQIQPSNDESRRDQSKLVRLETYTPPAPVANATSDNRQPRIGVGMAIEDQVASRRFASNTAQHDQNRQTNPVATIVSSQFIPRASPQHSPNVTTSQPNRIVESEDPTLVSNSRPGTSTGFRPENASRSLRHPGNLPAESTQPNLSPVINSRKPNDIQENENEKPPSTARPAVESRDIAGGSISRPGTSTGVRYDGAVSFVRQHEDTPRENASPIAPTPIVNARRVYHEKSDHPHQILEPPTSHLPRENHIVHGTLNNRPDVSEGMRQDIARRDLRQSDSPHPEKYQISNHTGAIVAIPTPAQMDVAHIPESNHAAGRMQFNPTGANAAPPAYDNVSRTEAQPTTTVTASRDATKAFTHTLQEQVAQSVKAHVLPLPLPWNESAFNAPHPMSETMSRSYTAAQAQVRLKSNENSPVITVGPAPNVVDFPYVTQDVHQSFIPTQIQERTRTRVGSLPVANISSDMPARTADIANQESKRIGVDSKPTFPKHNALPEQPPEDSTRRMFHTQHLRNRVDSQPSAAAHGFLPSQPKYHSDEPNTQEAERVRVNSQPTAPHHLALPHRTADVQGAPRQSDSRTRADSKSSVPNFVVSSVRPTEDYVAPKHPIERDLRSRPVVLPSQQGDTTDGVTAQNKEAKQDSPNPHISRYVPSTVQAPVQVESTPEERKVSLSQSWVPTVPIPGNNSKSQAPPLNISFMPDEVQAISSHPPERSRHTNAGTSNDHLDNSKQYVQNSAYTPHPRPDRIVSGPHIRPSDVKNPVANEIGASVEAPSLGFYSEAFSAAMKAPKDEKSIAPHKAVDIIMTAPNPSTQLESISNRANQLGTSRDHLITATDDTAHTRALYIDRKSETRGSKTTNLHSEHPTLVNRQPSLHATQYTTSTSRRPESSQPRASHIVRENVLTEQNMTVNQQAGYMETPLPPPTQSAWATSMAERLFQSRQAVPTGPTPIVQARRENESHPEQESSSNQLSYQATTSTPQVHLKVGQSIAENLFRSKQDPPKPMPQIPSQLQPKATSMVAESIQLQQDNYRTLQPPLPQTNLVSPPSHSRINHPVLADLLSPPPAKMRSFVPKNAANTHAAESGLDGLNSADLGARRIDIKGVSAVDAKNVPLVRPSSTFPGMESNSQDREPHSALHRPSSVQPNSRPAQSTEPPVQSSKASAVPSQPVAVQFSSSKHEYGLPSLSANYSSLKINRVAPETDIPQDRRAQEPMSIAVTNSASHHRSAHQNVPDSLPNADPTSESRDIRSRYQAQASSATTVQSIPGPISSRHHHTASLPVTLGPAYQNQRNISKEDMPRSAAPTQTHYKTASLQIPAGQQASGSNVSLPRAPSEETILMTPSSLAQSLMLQPTVSRQSATPSTSSQNARKGIFSLFRRTPAPQPEPPQKFEFWHPGSSSKNPQSTPSHSKAREHTKEATHSSYTPPKVEPSATSMPIPIQVPVENDALRSLNPDVFTPFRFTTSRRNRAISVASLEAQDGTAANTVVGSPTASMHSQVPIQSPPARDIRQATEAWRNKEEAAARARARENMRRQRPGVVFDVEEEHPDQVKKRPRRVKTRGRTAPKPREDA